MARTDIMVRLWKILKKLHRSCEGLPWEYFCRRFNYTQSTLYRDIETLQLAGFPIYRTGYRLTSRLHILKRGQNRDVSKAVLPDLDRPGMTLSHLRGPKSIERKNMIVRQWEILRLLDKSRNGITSLYCTLQLEVSLNTFYRDIQVLQRARYPIFRTGHRTSSVWRIQRRSNRGYHAPYLPEMECGNRASCAA